MNTHIHSKRFVLHLGAAVLGALVFSAAQAAMSPEAAYREEVARCNSGKTGQDRATCLREAGAALQEARRGRLRDEDPSIYEKNRILRCNALPEADRPACIARAEGRGTVTGSVEGGGLLREYREVVPATEAGSAR
ncbi:hypothetical protein [uncultured Pigmentiphaga sp.]|uniref:hypothetical protein n=1 Tax=uncultured Pigmentiphaga sp. TaxID=340361 RepID=UPI00262D2DC4|nr:hypothetical protein [uncultured Pigmentiphaga sp.]